MSNLLPISLNQAQITKLTRQFYLQYMQNSRRQLIDI